MAELSKALDIPVSVGLFYKPVPNSRVSPRRKSTQPPTSKLSAAPVGPRTPPGPHSTAGLIFACSNLNVQSREAPFLNAFSLHGTKFQLSVSLAF